MKNFVIVFELFRIMIAALSFLLDYENIEDANSDDSDASSSEDDSNPQMLVFRTEICLYFEHQGCDMVFRTEIFCILCKFCNYHFALQVYSLVG